MTVNSDIKLEPAGILLSQLGNPSREQEVLAAMGYLRNRLNSFPRQGWGLKEAMELEAMEDDRDITVAKDSEVRHTVDKDTVDKHTMGKGR